jgi:hypothetical protein
MLLSYARARVSRRRRVATEAQAVALVTEGARRGSRSFVFFFEENASVWCSKVRV